MKILAVNPGSTSTKIAVFEDETAVFRDNVQHAAEELARFEKVQDQLHYRTQTVLDRLREHGITPEQIDVFVGRGGGLLPTEGGVYRIDGLVLEHASRGMMGQHPAQLASQICYALAQKGKKPAYIVNPPDTDEFIPEARLCGVRDMYRQSHVHALNQKEIALRFCKDRGLDYEKTNLIVCHLGGGISITAHRMGRMIDSNDIMKGSGPMTPTRAGEMPYLHVIDMAYSGQYTKQELTAKLNSASGLIDHFGTDDVREVEALASQGDAYAQWVLDGMVYQIAKYVGSMAVALRGQFSAILLTGGLSRSAFITQRITDYVSWLAEVVVLPGEFEMEALASGALRAERGETPVKHYTGAPVWTPPQRMKS